MPIFIEILFHFRMIAAALFTEGELLNVMLSSLVFVNHFPTSVPFWICSPCLQLLPIAAFFCPYMPTFHGTFSGSNGQVRRNTHDVLSQRFEAVVYVMSWNGLGNLSAELGDGAAKNFLGFH